MHVIPPNIYLNKVFNHITFTKIDKCVLNQISGQRLDTQNKDATCIGTEGVVSLHTKNQFC
jgi:hypothetical protein